MDPLSRPHSDEDLIRIIVAEDNDDLRNLLGPLLDAMPGLNCAGATAYLGGVVPLIEQHRAQVVLLDLQLRDGPVTAHLAEMSASHPATRFIIHSGHANPALIIKALEAGAQAYVAKSGDIDELIATIRRVAAS